MRWALLSICVCLCIGGAARAQTTQPTKWADHITNIAKVLVHPAENADFRSVMTDDASVRSLDGGTAQYSQLATSATDAEVITARGYDVPATTIASDIAGDFSASSSIPDSIRQIMIPASDKDMRLANEVAAQWIPQALSATEGQHIGVIILRGKASTTQPAENAEETRPLIMVLIKGDLLNGVPQITRVVFGDPRTMMK